MAEEIDDNDFYRENFSADSDWEVFNVQLGEILQNWDVTNVGSSRTLLPDELYHCKWQVKTETLNMLRHGIAVDYYEAELKAVDTEDVEDVVNSCLQRTNCHQDLMSLSNNFGSPIRSADQPHTLARMYGLRRFIVLHPANMAAHYLRSTSEFNFFLSAVAVVAAEVASVVPIFVQIYDPKWNFYTGVALAPTLRTNFRLVGLERSAPTQRYLTGLLTMFHEKLPAIYTQPATVSVRITLRLDMPSIHMPMHVPFSHSGPVDYSGVVQQLETQHFHALPHGYTQASRTECHLAYTWPEMSEHVAYDSEERTSFTPANAPFCKLYLNVEASSYLSCCLRDYQAAGTVTRSLESYVGRNFSGMHSGADASNPLDQLTAHKLPGRRERNYELPSQAGLTKQLPGPMTESELNEMLAYLFPDMHPDTALFPYNKQSGEEKFDPLSIKSAVPDSLVFRLSSLLATCHAHMGGLESMAQLWAAFTRELRFLWDNALTVPGITPGFPDTRTCLLHQKLQMLNICVERSVSREAAGRRRAGAAEQPQQQQNNDDDDNDDDNDDEEAEFFDCDEPSSANASPTKTVVNQKPEGRLKPLGKQCLLDEPEELLYLPITQEPVPKTEDQLEEDAEAMLKLGPGSGLSTQMMCSSLLSDMEAFKAANPRAQMADFIRWYSPKDWEQSAEAAGRLSVRMTTPGNTWQTVWQQAQPVPVARQRRLFDDTNEALKVLHYLETRNMSEIYALTIMPTLHAALFKLCDIFSNSNAEEIFGKQIAQLQADLCRLSRTQASHELPQLEPWLEQLATLERRFYQFKSFERICQYPFRSSKAQLTWQFEQLLTQDNSCTVINRKLAAAGDVLGSGGTLHDILEPQVKSGFTGTAVSREYVIRLDGDTKLGEHGLYLGPQFLRAIVCGEKVRLCGAFTESTAFY